MDVDALGLFLQDLFVPGTSLVEKIVRPVAVYAFLIVILRVGGRREREQQQRSPEKRCKAFHLDLLDLAERPLKLSGMKWIFVASSRLGKPR